MYRNTFKITKFQGNNFVILLVGWVDIINKHFKDSIRAFCKILQFGNFSRLNVEDEQFNNKNIVCQTSAHQLQHL